MFRTRNKVDRGRAPLYRILFGFVTLSKRRSRSGGPMARQGTPRGSPLECSCVKLTPVLAHMTARLTAASSAAREGLATRLPTSTVGKRLPKWHTHMVLIAGPRPKRRPPGFRRDLRGLSHSADPHTTIYTWTLLSWSTLVAQRCTLCYHARGLQLRTRQSSEPWSEFEHKPSLRNNASEARYPGLRGGSMDDGSRKSRALYTLLARD